MPRARSPRNGSTRSISVSALSTPSNSDVITGEEKKKAGSSDVESEIRRRAYELYEQRGYTEGYEKEDWLVAEREIMARYNNQHSA
jgi:Protein of unknown function (DUF2934)